MPGLGKFVRTDSASTVIVERGLHQEAVDIDSVNYYTLGDRSLHGLSYVQVS